MSEIKSSTSVDKKNLRHPILESLDYLFYVSKVFGVIPYSLSDYITKKQLKLSQFGGVFCILSCIHYATHYHFVNVGTMIEKDEEKSFGTLTTVIGIFIIYMEPLMMAIDVLASLVNQKSLIDVFDRLREIDEKLVKENILLDYRVIRRYSIIFMLIAFFGEITLGISNLFAFQETLVSLMSLWWMISCVPLFINGVAKTYFLILILLVQQRLRAINTYLNDTKQVFFERKIRYLTDNASVESNLKKDNLFIENIGYLEKEIFSTRNMKIKNGNAWNWVDKSSMTNRINDSRIFAQRKTGIINVVPYDPSRRSERIENWKKIDVGKKSMMMDNFHLNDSGSVIGDKMDKKLINLCRAHDEICDIAKQVNRLFSFQMLITMAYGFLAITAQFYFLYCGLLDQPIPVLFRTARNIPITTIFIGYTAYKCVVVIYISWKTKIESQKTGVQLHKIANVVDENHFYNVCNHLSLKLLNHHLNFTACGFFDLEMTTIYAISGAITSYLIILIQFNLAALRAKPSNSTAIANGTNFSDVFGTTISPLTFNTFNPRGST